MMFKKHAFKFITFLVFLVVAIAGYLFYSLTIFLPRQHSLYHDAKSHLSSDKKTG